MIALAITAILFSVLNRARGTQLFNLVGSTLIGRLAATLGMSITINAVTGDLWAMPTAWGALMLWCTPAWDKYWSAEIGNDPAHSRLWGLAMMALRMTLAAPAVVGLAAVSGHPDHALYAALCPLLALPYLLFGAIDKATAVERSEYAVGAMLGLLIFQTVT